MTNEKLHWPIRARIDSDDIIDNVITLIECKVSYRLILSRHHTGYRQQRIVCEGRPYEVEMIEDIKSLLKPGDHVIDVCINVVNHTLYLVAVADCHVTAIEMNPERSEAIHASVAINELNDWIVVNEKSGTGRNRYSRLGGMVQEPAAARTDRRCPVIKRISGVIGAFQIET